MVECSAVFHDVFNCVWCCVATWAGVDDCITKPLLIAKKGLMMSASQLGKVDSVLSGEGGCREDVHAAGCCL